MNTTANQILSILEEAGESISGEEISKQTGVTRSAVWKNIKELRERGYEIEASRPAGYRLTRRTDKLVPYEIKRHLKTEFIGKRIEYYESVPSTGLVAKDLCAKTPAGELNGTVIVAEEQSGGTGRLGRRWVSPPDDHHPETGHSHRPCLYGDDGLFHCACQDHPETIPDRGPHQMAQ